MSTARHSNPPSPSGPHVFHHNEIESLRRIESIETVDHPPSSISEEGHPPKPWDPLSTHVLTLLIPASIFGTLARVGLRALASYEGSSVFPLAYAQGLGCAVMGFVLQLKEPFGHFYPPLYTAIATGFCGSVTTFSGWQLDVFESWINAGHYRRAGLRDFIDGLGKSVFTLAISIASFSFGALMASAVHPFIPLVSRPRHMIRNIITILAILCYGAVFPVYFLLPVKYRHEVTAALLFAFPGTLTRYLLSVKLNTLLKALPLGTFLANSIGTALLAAFVVLQSKTRPVSPGVCSILQGLSDGYCGCLTTVSTFVAEVYVMNLRGGLRYALLSWSVGQVLLAAILGSSIWFGGAQDNVTCSFE